MAATHIGVWLTLLIASAGALVQRTLDYEYLFVGSTRQESAGYSTAVDHWFNQKLDHFHHEESRTWKQRFWIKKDFYRNEGPAFLMLGGEETNGHKAMIAGAWHSYAKTHHAIMFFLEHRFYGQSRPTSNTSLESLAYLSSEQALADAALFIRGMTRRYNLPEDTRWVAFGGSYAGNLAAWLRYKYPHLVTGAVASSAPVLAKLDFPEFFNVVKDSLSSTSGMECVIAVHDAFRELEFRIRNTPEELMGQLGLCEPLKNNHVTDVQTLFIMMASAVSKVVQYNNEETNMNINLFCDVMTDPMYGSPLDRYNISMRMVLQQERCKNFTFTAQLDKLRNVSFDEDSDRPWMYQTCSEFGYYQTSESKYALIGRSIFLKFFTTACADLFGVQFTRKFMQDAVEHTNMVYGGLDMKATRVIHVHGSTDPWHRLGITRTRIPESPAIFINGSSHCKDMKNDRPSDPPALKQAREQINSIIGEFLLQ